MGTQVRPWRAGMRRFGPAALGLVLFAAGIGALHHLLQEVHPSEVLAEVRATPPLAMLGAVLATAIGYAALVGYDYWALRFIGRRLPLGSVAVGSFLGSAFGNTVGASVVSGGAVRYRIYSALGLDAFEVAAVSSYIAVSTGLGLVFIGLGALVYDPAALGGVLPLALETVRWSAAVLFIGGLGGLVLMIASRRRLGFGRFSVALPSVRVSTGQLLVSLIDVFAAALALWLLLPAGKPEFAGFVAIFAVAMMVGVVSHVPGGVGVFEATVIAAMPPGASVSEIAAALLMFRLVYYLLPFALAFGFVAFGVARQAGGALARLPGGVPGPLKPVLAALPGVFPALVAAVTFGLGAFLILVSLVPSVRAGALAEGDLVGAILLEGGTLVSAVAGVSLIILSHGLLRRVRGAFWLSLVAIAGGVIAALLNGFDWETAALLTAGALALWPFRAAFYRDGKLTEGVFSPSWFALIAAVTLAAAAFFFFIHRATPYDVDLWTEFSRSANTPRALRAGIAASAALLIFSLFLSLQPHRARRSPAPEGAVLDRAAGIVAAQDDPQACLALTGDKALLFSEDETGFIMYGRHRRAWVALGDPVGPEASATALAWAFYDEANRAGGRPVFYEVSARYLPLWIEMGLALHKVGEEAVVKLPEFSLAGSKFKTMRAAYNKNLREGLAVEIVTPPHAEALLDELAAISDAWLGGKTGTEKGFSVGRFDRAWLNRGPIALVRREGRVVAFANILAPVDGRRVAIDLMRYLPEAASGLMEFLFIALMEHYRDAGAEEFSLGVAPLSGLAERPTAQAWTQAARLIFEHGGAFYNFGGLRAFKQKFRPEWRPRYVAIPPGVSPMVALADVTLLIAGGPRGILGK